MKKYLALFTLVGFMGSASLSLACPGSAQCAGANCQCQGNSCTQETPAPKKDKKAKNLKKPEETAPPTAAAAPSN